MPEYREILACLLIILRWLYTVQELLHASGKELRLLAIWIDATQDEQKAAPADSPASHGMVYKIDSACTAKRGSRSAQKFVWPHTSSGQALPDMELSALVLEDVSRTPRTVVLKMRRLCLQVYSRLVVATMHID